MLRLLGKYKLQQRCLIWNGKIFRKNFVWASLLRCWIAKHTHTHTHTRTHTALWSEKPTYLLFRTNCCSKYSPTTYTSAVINQSIKSLLQSITSSHTCTYSQILLMRGLKPGGNSKVLISLYASSERAAFSTYSVLFNVRYQTFVLCLEKKWILINHFGRLLACFERLQTFSCHHHISFMDLGHLLTRSVLTYPEVSSQVCHDSFCHLRSSISLPWVIYFEAFYLHVVPIFSCIPVICPKLVLFLAPLHLLCNLSKCILMFFSCISSLLLLFFWRHFL